VRISVGRPVGATVGITVGCSVGRALVGNAVGDRLGGITGNVGFKVGALYEQNVSCFVWRLFLFVQPFPPGIGALTNGPLRLH